MTVIELLNALKITGELRKYFQDALNYVIEEEQNFLDINLAKDIYPHLAEIYELSPLTVKTKFIRMVCEFNKEHPKIFKRYFSVNTKMTVKKVLTLMLVKLDVR